jgi:acyl-coenzyme A synthetase/AMP-(fatty) acid ligase
VWGYSHIVRCGDFLTGWLPPATKTASTTSAASPKEIMRFVAGEVAHYKQIRRLKVIDAIPKSAAGKILRRVLRDSGRT